MNTPQNKSPKEFSKSFMYSMHTCYFLIHKHLELTLTKHKGITFSQFLVLSNLSSSETKAVSQKEIAFCNNITEATVSRHIKTLETLSYIKKLINKKNKKERGIVLTKEGEDAHKQAGRIINKELEIIFKTLSSSNKATLLDSFQTIISSLQKH